MSSRNLEQIECACGEQFEAELWTSISVMEDPELKESLDAGEINVVCCPACSKIFYVEHFLLYHDSKNELLAFVYPPSFVDQKKQLTQKMNTDIDNALVGLDADQKFSYRPILVFGLDALIEIIHADDQWEDELAILEFLSEELHFSVISLHPAQARRNDLPRLLPSVPVAGGNRRASVLAGLELLLGHNELLSHFRAIRDRIIKHTDWTLSPELIIGPL
ncbi:MAG: CpXC domain-containing protein [Elusimicrobiota bacterium]